MPEIQISEETVEALRRSLPHDSNVMKSREEMIGKSYFFRTVTFHSVGRVVGFMGDFVQLESASWVADSGRFMNALKDGSLNEVEPTGTAFVNMQSVCDFFPWKHALPVEQK